MFTVTILIIFFAFFAQSLLGFGGGLICIPLLSLFMPVQDVVSMVMIYQFSMGLLIFSTFKDIQWPFIIKMLPSMILGVCLGIALLNYLPGDVMRGILAGYILLHLARKHTKFDPLGKLIKWGDAHLAGFVGGMLNAMIGGGGPAFILYLKDKATLSSTFRASIIAVLMLSNIPRVIGTVGTGLLTTDLFITGMYAYPAFLLALYAGQKLHKKIPQDKFFFAVELLLASSATLLIIKILL
tara:strand:- start:4131 stop:4850 length:720 start_codon:yes stop_codon:yes gene_type:complete